MSIYNLLEEKQKANIYSFHMPGHKGNIKLMTGEFEIYDTTELYETDNLYEPTGIINQAQKKIANLYGADASFMLVNGSTTGIISAILSVCHSNEEIILGRNSHRSVYSGLALSGAIPRYIYPPITDMGIAGAISVQEVQQLLEKYPASKAVLITSPTYEGFCSDIEQIANLVHTLEKILIVDEAHGAHFGFGIFPKSAISLGADIVIQSMHKTLTAPNQSALLHVKGERVDISRLKKAIALIQTTSPSYFFLSCMEKCVDLISQPDVWAEYTEMLLNFRREMGILKIFPLISVDVLDKWNIYDIDLSKLLFYVASDVKGVEIYEQLRINYSLELEMSGEDYVLGISSIADTHDGFCRLAQAMKALELMYKKRKKTRKEFLSFKPTCMIKPSDAVFAPEKRVLIKNAEGFASADFIIPYPPGIPLLVPGELISSEAIRAMLFYKEQDIRLLGTMNETVSVLEIN